MGIGDYSSGDNPNERKKHKTKGSRYKWWTEECEKAKGLKKRYKDSLLGRKTENNLLNYKAAVKHYKTICREQKRAYYKERYKQQSDAESSNSQDGESDSPKQQSDDESKERSRTTSKTKKSMAPTTEEDELDLSKSLYSLAHYIGDEAELVSQMFSAIRGAKLDDMMPQCLKKMPLLELRRLCIHELQGMSKSRMLASINGVEMEDSSDEDDDYVVDETTYLLEKKDEIINSSTKISSPKNRNDTPTPSPKKKRQRTNENVTPQKDGKSVLEIRELELRAKLIKKMLGKRGELNEKVMDDLMNAPASEFTAKVNEIKDEHRRDSNLMDVVVVKAEKGSSDDEPQIIAVEDVKTEHKSKKHKSKKRSDKSSRKSKRKHHHRDRSVSPQVIIDDDDPKQSNGELNQEQPPERSKPKKKKISKKEFEERMKIAKNNRQYRKKKDYLEDSILQEPKKAVTEKEKDGEEGEIEKEEGEADEEKGPESEKEEGEIDSNEEEEGACSPSDDQSDSSHSSRRRSRYRRRSRSYSSFSSGSFQSRSSRSRSRSYSRSYSRSRSRSLPRTYGYSRNKYRGSTGKVSLPSPQKSSKTASKTKTKEKESTKAKTNDIKKEENNEDNWGEKCDIEFVDSEEDFDERPVILNKTKVALKKREDRTAVSFSFQKKRQNSIKANPMLTDDIAANKSKNGNDELDETNTETTKEKSHALEIDIQDSSTQGEEMETNDNDDEIIIEQICDPASKKTIIGEEIVLDDELDMSPVKGVDKADKDNKKERVYQNPVQNLHAVVEKVQSTISFSEVSNTCKENSNSASNSSKSKSTSNLEKEKNNIRTDFSNLKLQLDSNSTTSDNVKDSNTGLESGEVSDDVQHTINHESVEVDAADTLLRLATQFVSNTDNPNSTNDLPEETESGELLELVDLPEKDMDAQISEEEELDEYQTYDPTKVIEEPAKSTETEIIGEMDTTVAPENAQENEYSSWSKRWLNSEKVQKVVTNSKMFNRIRKKIHSKEKIKKQKKQIPIPEPQPEAEVVEEPVEAPPSNPSVIGSIEEYKKIMGTDAIQKKVITLGSDDSDDDSENEALWSTIMRK